MDVQTITTKRNTVTLAQDGWTVVLFCELSIVIMLPMPQTSQNTFHISKQNAQVCHRKSSLQGFFCH